MTREDVVSGYMINEKHVIAEMLYDTITKYEQRIAELEEDIRQRECLEMDATAVIKSLHNDIDELENSYQIVSSKLGVADRTINAYSQLLKQLEAPKTCDGCIHIDTKGSCYDCSRYYTDYYEPKDK